MFQTFDPVSDRSFAAKHLPLLRAQLDAMGLDGFIIPHDDEYQNEYIPAYAERLMWASGFSGSAGAAIVLRDRAVVFSDGRYTLQLRQQVDNDYFDYADITETSLAAWLKANAPAGAAIGYDPKLHAKDALDRLTAAADKRGFRLVAVADNPIDAAWSDQPPRPKAPVVPHPEEFAGESSEVKRAKIGAAVAEAGADAVLITAPPSIAWLFNVRGGDVERSPLPLGRALVHADGAAELFVDPDKVDNALPEHLGDRVQLRAETAVDAAVTDAAKAGKTIAVDPSLTPVHYLLAINEAGGKVVELTDPCAVPRAAKNPVELDGARAAHIRDGAAICRFLHWLDQTAHDGSLDEIGAAKKLEEFRAETGVLVDLSFDSISGAGPNGAICHYRVSTDSNRPLKPGELFLIDSGGQYRDGTTDITRTMPIGQHTDEMADRFTRVLQGHIALAVARFPKGTTGHQLDVIARRPLWQAGLDFDHGTGHGVGSFLGVHEGPQRISKAPNSQPLLPGMILSNEPGYYKDGEFGIRIENLIIVTPAAPIDGGERTMLGFETITLAPIDLRLVKGDLLTDDEREWLNAYHQRVRETLTPLVPSEVKDWLAEATRAI